MLTQNRITRSLSVLLCLCLMCACLVVPARASEVAGNDESWFNVLDYTTVTNTAGTSWTSSATYTFTSDSRIYYRYIDLTVYVTGKGLTGAYISYSSGDTALSLRYVGDGIYRVYGKVATNTRTLNIKFTNNGSGTSSTNITRFYASSYITSHFGWNGDLYYNGELFGTTSSASGEIAAFTGLGGLGVFEVGVHVDDWQKFDYLDVLLELRNVQAVNSIMACSGDVYLPISEVQWVGAEANNTIQVLARIDLTGLNRTSTDSVILSVMAYAWGDSDPHIKLQSVSGYVVTELADPVFSAIKTLQTNLSTWFSDLSSSISSGLTTVSSNIVSSIQNLQTNMSTWFADLGSTISSGLTSVKTNIVSSITSLKTTMVSWFTTVSDQLATLVGTGTEGDSLSDASGELNDAADDVFDYEQSQQEILTNSFPAIQETVSFTGFVTALMFVQKYTNLTYAGLGDVSIIYMLPLVLGLFFYLCSRIPGATRWPARTQRKKDGDST